MDEQIAACIAAPWVDPQQIAACIAVAMQPLPRGHPPPPGRGPLPNGTAWWPDPQGSAVILEDCQVDSFGSKARDEANIWLDELPAVLAVRRCLGFAYDPKWGPAATQSLLKVNASVDLDGPLWLADDIENGLRYEDGKVFPPSQALWG